MPASGDRPDRPGRRPAVRALKVILAAIALAAGCARLPDLGLDRTPLSIDAPLTAATRGRLVRTTADPAACRAWLNQAGIGFSPVQDRSEDGFCVVTGAGLLGDQFGPVKMRMSPRRPMMTCQLAAAIAVWRRQSVEPAAEELLGASVRQIDHLGVYACRRIYNQAEGPASSHARAAAIDVAGFRLSDGRRISVERDWRSNSAAGQFLHRIRDDGCRVFGTTLSPDYNAAHATHLHLESGAGGACG
jgi:hypothetical protein